jgi:hypothetical protein
VKFFNRAIMKSPFTIYFVNRYSFWIDWHQSN